MTTPYDQVRYENLAYALSHPSRIATVATLLGLSPAPVESCRVLEIGCGDGANLIPMAERLPDAHFTGFDYAASAVAAAGETIAALGLTNIRVFAEDILAADPGLEQYDYIIAHGIYSWVPAPVRDRLLAMCQAHLAPGGVAYVSHNCYPGWHVRALSRDLALFHVRDIQDPTERTRAARALAQRLAPRVVSPDPYSVLLRQDLERVAKFSDSIITYDLIGPNEPVYFHQFAAHAQGHGLQYLGDADFSVMSTLTLPPELRAAFGVEAKDVLAIEQYADFIRQRAFRHTLLCRPEQAIDRTAPFQRVRSMHFACGAQVEGATGNLKSDKELTFRRPESAMSTREPLVKAALLHLTKVWPRYLPLAELLKAAVAAVQGGAAMADPDSREAHHLADVLLHAHAHKVVDVLAQPPRFVTAVSPQPLTTPLVRLEAQRGDVVTSLKHEAVKVGELDRQLLGRLDGRTTVDALVAQIAALPATEPLSILKPTGPQAIVDRSARGLAPLVARTLQDLARQALLLE